jgi:ubiquinone/menaquinone biosynthesis C-methylase UbiE
MQITNYLDVTEIAGDDVTQEQVDRLYHRYYWAGTFCQDKDVLEVACGTGQGLGYLANIAKSLEAGDYSQEIIDIAKSHYGDRISLRQLDAQNLPYANSSKDVIILFEAIYYLPDAEKFVQECCRILRKGGKILIATANKDLYDFNPSPYTYKYYGVVELNELFSQYGFTIECFGVSPINKVSFKQRILRPVKKIAVQLGLIPKTMKGKKMLKKLVFGQLIKMPSEIKENLIEFKEPQKLLVDKIDTQHKVLYCVATLPKIN